MLSIVLAEDNLLVREGVRSVLSASDEVEVAAACADADELRLAIEEFNPDVVVTDIHMPPGLSDEGIQVARELRRDRPTVGVVVLSSRDEPQHALDLLEHGSAGRAYLLKERVGKPGQLLQAVLEVAKGGSVIDPQVVEKLVRTRSRPDHVAARVVDTEGAGGAGRDGRGPDEWCHRATAFPDRSGSRGTHPDALREAGVGSGTGRPSPGAGGAALPLRALARCAAALRACGPLVCVRRSLSAQARSRSAPFPGRPGCRSAGCRRRRPTGRRDREVLSLCWDQRHPARHRKPCTRAMSVDSRRPAW